MTNHLHLAGEDLRRHQYDDALLPATVFEEWYRLHHRRLRAMCDRMLRDAAMAEDVAQETLLRAWKRRDQFAEGVDVGPWLRTVARNLCIEAIRARTRAIPTADGLDEHPDTEADPSYPLERAEEHRAVREALGTLSPRHQAMLYARDVHGVDYSELASREGLTENATRAVLFRARRVLRCKIEQATRAVGAVILILRVKARHAAGRATDAALQPVAAIFANGALGAALAITSVLATGGVPTATAAMERHHVAASTRAIAATIDLQTAPKDGSSTMSRLAQAAQPASGITAGVDRSKGDVHAKAKVRNPATGNDEYVWTHVWRDHGTGDNSAVLGAADQAANAACAQSTQSCDAADQILKG